MIKPVADFMILEKYQEVGNQIVTPDNVKPKQEDVFVILDIGPGFMTEKGDRIKPEVEVGDKIYVYGKIIQIPHNGKRIIMARAFDVIAYERNGDKLEKNLDIPDKV